MLQCRYAIHFGKVAVDDPITQIGVKENETDGSIVHEAFNQSHTLGILRRCGPSSISRPIVVCFLLFACEERRDFVITLVDSFNGVVAGIDCTLCRIVRTHETLPHIDDFNDTGTKLTPRENPRAVAVRLACPNTTLESTARRAANRMEEPLWQ